MKIPRDIAEIVWYNRITPEKAEVLYFERGCLCIWIGFWQRLLRTRQSKYESMKSWRTFCITVSSHFLSRIRGKYSNTARQLFCTLNILFFPLCNFHVLSDIFHQNGLRYHKQLNRFSYSAKYSRSNTAYPSYLYKWREEIALFFHCFSGFYEQYPAF